MNNIFQNLQRVLYPATEGNSLFASVGIAITQLISRFARRKCLGVDKNSENCGFINFLIWGEN